VEKLKAKIKKLESQLYSNQDHLPSPTEDVGGDEEEDDESNSSQEPTVPSDSLPNEQLNLGKKFDMLHIKSNTTVHLGATSWLAIMKGDPYLRVLWTHIFKMRKKVEQMKLRNKLIKEKRGLEITRETVSPNTTQNKDPEVCPISGKDSSSGKCPVSHDMFSEPEPQPTPSTEMTSCPISGKNSSEGKCPVSYEMFSETAAPSSMGSSCPVMNTDISSVNKCPVSHVRAEGKARQNEDGQTINGGTSPVVDAAIDNDDTSLQEKVCPLMIGDSTLIENFNPKNASVCPVVNDKKPKRRASKSAQNSAEIKKPKVSEKQTALQYSQNPVLFLEAHLPKKKILWLHIKRFFEVLYVYMPYVDEASFIEELKYTFGEEDDKDQDIKIKVRDGVEFAFVGTVSLILRLSWHTLPMNNSAKLLKKSFNSKTYKEDQSVIDILQAPDNEVQLKLVDCVKQCFSNMKLMRKSNLKIVQCALYMRLYFMYSPDDGDGADGGDSQIFLGMIIQMAVSIGLHRDPKNFENFSNERQRHLWRKIWFKLISLDVAQSMNLGCPRVLQSHLEFSDTDLPGDSDDGLTLEKFKMDLRELAIIKSIHTQAKVDDLISKTMKILLNVNKPARKFQVDQLIDQLEQCISGFEIINDKYALPQIGKLLVNRSKDEKLYASATRAIEFRLHVTVNMLLYLLNYILYVHFEPRACQDPQISKIAKTYAQKALNSALEGYRNCTLFFDCGADYFGPGSDLILAPLLLLVGHRSMQFMVSLILRSRCGPFMKPTLVGKGNSGDAKDFKLENQEDVGDDNHTNHDLDNVEIKDESGEIRSDFNVDVNSGERLATILLGHMGKFHKLAETLGQKYSYSWRMGKAVGFFVTLLKKPVNIVKDLVKTDSVKDVESNKGISNVLEAVPLVLSKEEERLNNEKNNRFQRITEQHQGQESIPKTTSTTIPEYAQANLFNPFFDNLEANLSNSNNNDTSMIDQFKNDLQQSESFLNLKVDPNQDLGDTFGLNGLMPDLDMLQSSSMLDNFMNLDNNTDGSNNPNPGVGFDGNMMSNSWFS